MRSTNSASVDFILAEINTVHALCDRALVPREAEGEILSMSQRVNCLEACYRGVIRDLGKFDPTVLH